MDSPTGKAPFATDLQTDSRTTARTAEQRTLTACPICESRRLYYAFSRRGLRLVRCADCRLLFLNPQPTGQALRAVDADPDVGRSAATPAGREGVSLILERETARHYLREIGRYRGRHGGELLIVSEHRGDFGAEATRLGYKVTAVETGTGNPLGQLASACPAATGTDGLDVCVIADVLENVPDPVEFLQAVRSRLRPGGLLFLSTPALETGRGGFLSAHWQELPQNQFFYFDATTIQNVLYKAGYEGVLVFPQRQVMTLADLSGHASPLRAPAVARLLGPLLPAVPPPLRAKHFPVRVDGLVAFARPARTPARRMLSIILPAYNEAATFASLMERLLGKEVRGVDIEIIVVESNSRDGTRELALRFREHPRVRVVLEDRPCGKGHAVRNGFRHARGDFVLIQDADLEYDLDDYDALLEPLLNGREAFVLGARHGGHAWWKMRRFAKQPLLSVVMNSGHWFFTTLVNLLFGLRLKDPFTMFKVFRRDCLFGLEFFCNRFDFDYELLIKLVRKGYRPIEIPVNYRSRSFGEGKKVSMFRDPLTWLRAIAKLRVEPLRLLEHASQSTAAEPARVADAARPGGG